MCFSQTIFFSLHRLLDGQDSRMLISFSGFLAEATSREESSVLSPVCIQVLGKKGFDLKGVRLAVDHYRRQGDCIKLNIWKDGSRSFASAMNQIAQPLICPAL